MQPRDPASVDDGLDHHLPVALDVPRRDRAADVLLPVDLLRSVGEQEVTGPRQRQVLDTDLEHSGVHERGGADEDQWDADATAQGAERPLGAKTKRAQFLHVVLLRHQADALAEGDNPLLFAQ